MRLFAFRSRKNERHPVPPPSRRQLAALNGHARASEEEGDVVGGQQGWLTAELVQKSYRGRMVVKGVSLATARGEAVGLLGPNGAGKTTVFYMITGLVPAELGAHHAGRARCHRAADVSPSPPRHRLFAAGSLNFPWPDG